MVKRQSRVQILGAHSLVAWLNGGRDTQAREIVAQAIREMQERGGKLRSTSVMRYFAPPIQIRVRIIDGRPDLAPHDDRAHGIMLFFDAKAAGLLKKLRVCQKCGKWLYARFPHQRFCSTTCKDNFHAFNEADKKRRREWARANYQTRKELELGSRKAAQRKGGK